MRSIYCIKFLWTWTFLEMTHSKHHLFCHNMRLSTSIMCWCLVIVHKTLLLNHLVNLWDHAVKWSRWVVVAVVLAEVQTSTFQYKNVINIIFFYYSSIFLVVFYALLSEFLNTAIVFICLIDMTVISCNEHCFTSALTSTLKSLNAASISWSVNGLMRLSNDRHDF